MSLFDYISDQEKDLIRKIPMPTTIDPMRAQLTNHYFSDKNWLFETKLDGERCLLFKKGKKITLKSRNDKTLNASYPEIVDQIKILEMPDLILDGEIVTFKNKVSNFSLLQERFGTLDATQSKISIYYYIFDIIYYNGYSLIHLPLITRKNILKNLIPFKGFFRYLPHKSEKGELYYKQACEKKLEGIIAKRKNSSYVFKRSSDWRKFKCSNEQEFVIAGYTDSSVSNKHFGSLLLGYYKNNVLHYAGKVGTGWDDQMVLMLGKMLKKYTRTKSPFSDYDDSLKNVHWVKPVLVCQIQFTEWTVNNKLRHPSFLGLRRDKSPQDVVQELP